MNTGQILRAMHLALIRSGVTLVITVDDKNYVVSEISGHPGRGLFYRTLCGKSFIADDIQHIKHITDGVMHESAHS